jgi:glycerate kinase
VRLVIAPDKFAGTFSASEVAEAVASGWAGVRPSDELRELPMSDGGPGFLAVLSQMLPGAEQLAVVTTDPLGRTVPGVVLLHAGSAYVESAQALGLHLLTPGERDPELTTSAGLATLLVQAAASGADRLVVGLGGSATNDGGRGLLEALLAGNGGPDLIAELRRRTLVLASDVTNPLLGLTGATAIFGPQKGAGPEAVARLEGRMQAWVRELPGLEAVADRPAAGAAGGVGAALLWLGGRAESGAELVAAAAGLSGVLADADLVITGEGAYDSTSLRGKVVGTVAAAAQEAALPCVVLAGQVSVGRREAAAHGVDEMLSLAELAGSVEAAMADTGRWLGLGAAKLAAGWGPR